MHGICFCPYLVPMHLHGGGGRGFSALGRYGLWISDKIKDHYKIVKVVS